MEIMQGDSYPINMELTLDDIPLTPAMVAEVEVCVGNKLRKLYTKGEVLFDESTNKWYIYPTQTETLLLPVGSHSVIVRISNNSSGKKTVIGAKLGAIKVTDSISEEEI